MIYAIAIRDWMSILLNSNFAIAFIGGLTGAVGGALGAQHIAERAKRRDDLLKELRSTNAAIMVSFSIFNAAIALKKQQVLPLKEQFLKEKDALAAYTERRRNGAVAKEAQHRIAPDLRTFQSPIVPIETLKSLVYDRISAFGRPLALVAALDQSLVGLAHAVEKRDALVNRFATGAIPAEQFVQYYFGLPLPGGDTNHEYPDLIEAIDSYVNDILFFSSLLCADLIIHGEAVRKPLMKKNAANIPRVSIVDFSEANAKGLIPADKAYLDWINSFKEQRGREA